MGKKEIKEKLEELFAKNGFNIREIDTINVLDIDSVLYIQLICDIEACFDILLPDEFLLFNSLHDIDGMIDAIYSVINF